METQDFQGAFVTTWATALFSDEKGFRNIDFSRPKEEVVEAVNLAFGDRPKILAFNLRWEMMSGMLDALQIEDAAPGDEEMRYTVVRALIFGQVGTAICISPSPGSTELKAFEAECALTIRKLPFPASGTRVAYRGRPDRRTWAALAWRVHDDGRACVQFLFPKGNRPEAAAVFFSNAYRHYLATTYP